MNTPTKGLLALVCACLIALGIYLKGYHDSDTKHLLEAQSAQLAFNKKQEEEREKSQAALADISKQWQAYLAKKSSVAQGTIDRLRSDGISLRVQLADATVRSISSDGRSVPNGYAELHPNTSRFLIEQAQRADHQVTALQQTIRELQGERQGGN